MDQKSLKSETTGILKCKQKLRVFPVVVKTAGNFQKNKKAGSTTCLFSLKLTNLTKPKLMKKNVLQIYIPEVTNCEKNC
jgi:hypothetical protein